ncbi:ATP/GTP-binding protein [Streptomyces nigra]|uniref:ATP/GTP-binding protein n=1 Tax=Streptomyces nigra TaxID=1827580 RepID=UPI0036C44741
MEPTLTRLFLLVIFGVGLVAQFVTPVGDALADKVYLGGALLTVVGYVLYAEVQRLNAAHTVRVEAELSLDAMVRRLEGEVQRLNALMGPKAGELVTLRELEHEFLEALETRRGVQLMAMGFTGETMATPLIHILQGLSRNPLRTVSLRVLVPDFTQSIEIPGRLGPDGKATDAPEFRAQLWNKIMGFERDLKVQVGRMAAAERGTLSVEFRVLHISPSTKLYFINDDAVYEGMYDKVDLRPSPWPAESPSSSTSVIESQLLDLVGHDALLTRWSAGNGDPDRSIILRRRQLFETLWIAARTLPA